MIIEITGRGSVRLTPWPEAQTHRRGRRLLQLCENRRDLGWRPTVSLRGTRRMVDFYRSNRQYYWD
ncbi:MAG: hypothetical protein R3A10_12430 [Caldilineaceae bacterium]